MSKTTKNEQPGVVIDTIGSPVVKTQIYVIAPSEEEYDKICERANQEHITVFTPPKNEINISRRPADGQMVMDLREYADNSDEFVEAP